MRPPLAPEFTASASRDYIPPTPGPSGQGDVRPQASVNTGSAEVPHGCPCKADRSSGTGTGLSSGLLALIPPDADAETAGIWHNAGPAMAVGGSGFVVSPCGGPFLARIDATSVGATAVKVNDPVGVRNGVEEWAVGSLGWRIRALYADDADGNHWALIEAADCAAETTAAPAGGTVTLEAIDEDGNRYGVELTVNVLST